MTAKKINPTNPDTEADAGTADKKAAKASNRKTAGAKIHPRKTSHLRGT